MRILFVSGTATGGSAMSTEALAERLAGRGHAVGLLQRDRPARVGLAPPTPALATTVRRARSAVERLRARRPRAAVPSSTGPRWRTRHLEAVASQVVAAFAPDVIVVNTVHARAWEALRGEAARAGIPVALYIREQESVAHIARGARPDLVLANAESHASAVAEHGVVAIVVPSIVELNRCAVASTRSHVLFVNPIPSRGLATAIEVARLRPDLRFAFQETHPLDDEERRRFAALLGGLDNVSVRPCTTDVASVYRDAAVLLVPYLGQNRPRVVLEAQSNGIPVIASDRPGLDECVPPGGVLVPPDASPAAWVEAIAGVLDDPDRYQRFVAAAVEHARRDDVDPDTLTGRFEGALRGVVPQT